MRPFRLTIIPLAIVLISAFPFAFVCRGQNQIGVGQFQSWIFQNERDPKLVRKKLDALIDTKLEQFSQVASLNEQQQRKITLAGRGDVERFFAKVDLATAEFEKLNVKQQNLNEAYQLAIPLMQEYQKGLFEDDSLFSKTLLQTLNDSQRDAWQAMQRKLQVRRLQSAIKLQIALYSRKLAMTEDQRQQFEALLMNDLPVRSVEPQMISSYANYLISQIPKDEINKIFDMKQAAAMDRIQQTGKGMKQFLIAQGVIDE